MQHVYIDESGDIGRKSKYIVFASVITDNPRHLEKALKKIWRAKPQLHGHGELHANKVDDSTRNRVLKTLNELDIAFRYLAIDKSTQSEPLVRVYYRELAAFVVQHSDAHIIIVDKKDTNKKRQKTIELLGLQANFENVLFEESHKVKQLQAVDFIAWAIGRHYEADDSTFMDIIRGKLL